MKVEIWSDVVCPWCYIGKRRFENALAGFEHRDQVEVIWRSFQLDPNAPANTHEPLNELLAGKYGVSLAQATAMNERVTGIAAEEGLEYHLDRAKHSNTFDAHRLIHLAAKHGKQAEMKERLMRAYFTEGEPIGDTDTLVRLASDIDLDAAEARAVLTGGDFAGEVKADLQRARAFGIRGVPFFAIDEKYGISGAQPTEVFDEALEQMWIESHPLVAIATQGGTAAGTCEGDTCTV